MFIIFEHLIDSQWRRLGGLGGGRPPPPKKLLAPPRTPKAALGGARIPKNGKK